MQRLLAVGMLGCLGGTLAAAGADAPELVVQQGHSNKLALGLEDRARAADAVIADALDALTEVCASEKSLFKAGEVAHRALELRRKALGPNDLKPC